MNKEYNSVSQIMVSIIEIGPRYAKMRFRFIKLIVFFAYIIIDNTPAGVAHFVNRRYNSFASKVFHFLCTALNSIPLSCNFSKKFRFLRHIKAT